MGSPLPWLLLNACHCGPLAKGFLMRELGNAIFYNDKLDFDAAIHSSGNQGEFTPRCPKFPGSKKTNSL